MFETIVRDVSDELIHRTSTKLELESLNVGAYSGIGGIYMTLQLCRKNGLDVDLACEHVETVVIEKLKRGEVNSFKLADGLMGLTVSIPHECSLGNIKRDLTLQLNKYVSDFSKEYLSRGNLDPLHGASSALIYYLDCNDVSLSKDLDFLVRGIIDQIKENNGVVYALDKGKRDSLNFSVSHGLLGVLSLVARLNETVYAKTLYTNFVTQQFELALELLMDSSYALKGELYPASKRNGQYYYSPRIAWCYGDLSSLIVLLRLSVSLKYPQKTRELKELILNVLSRQDLAYSKVEDPFFCHGAAGILFLMRKIEVILNENNFIPHDLWHFWQRTAVDLIKKYKVLNPLSFLDGVSGIVYGTLSSKLEIESFPDDHITVI